MIRLSTCAACVLAMCAVLFIGRLVAVQAAPSVTAVCGAISSDTAWTTANSPYEVCSGGATVNAGITLTVQSGVTVQFQSNGRLTTNGTLLASGTPTQPITFTGVSATPGSWFGFIVDSGVVTPAVASLSYVTFDYGGINNLLYGQVFADHAILAMDHSLVRNSAGNGLYATGNTRLDVSNTGFTNNGLNALRLIQPVSDLQLSSLSATLNGLNAVYVVGTTYLHGQRRWPAAGIPYVIDGVLGNTAGDSLTLDPGGELQFTSNGYLNIGGDLKAIGLPAAPLTLTGQVKLPGSWIGLVVFGGQQPANAQLEYVTLEYGGRNNAGANVTVDFGYLVVRNSIVRQSLRDGVRINSTGHGTLLNSQITSNTQYGVRNMVTSRSVLATNNWWGDPSGPTSDVAACSPGQGDKVTAGVLFRPVLSNTVTTNPFPLSNAPILTLTPQRWFASADGTTKIYFDITLRDGNGAPLPGRQVRLSTSLGIPTDGGITDVTGHTLATLVSSTAGEAEVTAALDVTGCEGALSPTTKVTFTPPVNITDLFPNSPASYFDGNIRLTPLPVAVGVTQTIQVTLTNPLTLPITVDVDFGFAQSGIGLEFGPIKTIVGQVIPAGGKVLLSASWLPIVAGHYCAQVSYTITSVGATHLLAPQATRQLQRFNQDIRQGPMGGPSKKDSLDKADKAFKKVEKLPGGQPIQKGIIDRWWEWAKDTAKKISQSLGGDPPRQDYNQITQAVWHTWPATQPSADISPARAAALNAASAALADVMAYGTAATVALDRYGGASEANDLIWAAQQANARLYYEARTGSALFTYADKLDAFVQVLNNEGVTQFNISAGDVISYQQQLQTQGFSPQEIADAHLIGLSDADIEALRQEIIAANPNDVAGNVLDFYRDEAAASRAAGDALLSSYNFAPHYSASGGAGLLAVTASGNTLAQINNTVVTLPVGNPLTQTALIDLRTRRIDLPADWTVSVSPAQVNLAAGAQTTVTVTILTGSLVPQNTIPRVAVEGYVGPTLLGGVAVDIVVPSYVVPRGIHDLFLPLIRR